MRSFRNSNYFAEAARPESDNARGTGRVKCLAIDSSHGRVLDLSAGGARLQRTSRFKGCPNTPFPLHIASGIGNCTIMARFCWEERAGMFSWRMGVAFEQVTPEATEVLNAIARAAPLHTGVMHHSLGKSA